MIEARELGSGPVADIPITAEMSLVKGGAENASLPFDGLMPSRAQINAFLETHTDHEYRELVQALRLDEPEQRQIVRDIQLKHKRASCLEENAHEAQALKSEIEQLRQALFVGNLMDVLELVWAVKRKTHPAKLRGLITEANKFAEKWFKREYGTADRARKAPIYPTDILCIDSLYPHLQRYRPHKRKKPTVSNPDNQETEKTDEISDLAVTILEPEIKPPVRPEKADQQTKLTQHLGQAAIKPVKKTRREQEASPLLPEFASVLRAHPRILRHMVEISKGRPPVLTEDTLGDYIRSAHNYPLLTAEREIELARIIQNGIGIWSSVKSGEKSLAAEGVNGALIEAVCAYQEFQVCNLRLVISTVKNRRKEVPLLDRVANGNLGLIHAIWKFDPEAGFKFSTYATWWIRQALDRELDWTEAYIRLPSHLAQKRRQVLRFIEQFENSEQRSPTDQEIMDEMDVSEEDLETFRMAGGYSLPSINTPIGEEGESELQDLIPSDTAPEGYEEVERRMLIDTELQQLLDVVNLKLEEKILLALQFGVLIPGIDRNAPLWPGLDITYIEAIKALEGTTERKGVYTQEGMAKLYGITREAVRLRLNRVREKLAQTSYV